MEDEHIVDMASDFPVPVLSGTHSITVLTAHNWQKWERVFLTCPCHKIDRDEAVGLQSCKYTWKNYNLCENVKFGAILWKTDILSIIA